MTKDNEMSWLRQACYVGGSAQNDEFRMPFSIMIEGEAWTACAGGVLFLAIKGGRGLRELSPEGQAKLDRGKAFGPIANASPMTSFASLLAFVQSQAAGRKSETLSRCRIGDFPVDAQKLLAPLSMISPPRDGLVRIRAEEVTQVGLMPVPLLIDGGGWRISVMGLNPKWVPFNVPRYELSSKASAA